MLQGLGLKWKGKLAISNKQQIQNKSLAIKKWEQSMNKKNNVYGKEGHLFVLFVMLRSPKPLCLVPHFWYSRENIPWAGVH
jgi:hypothetical protein